MKNLAQVVLATIMLCGSAFAIPQLVNYQGQLARPDGTPLDTTVTITFKLYSTLSGGTAAWTETHTGVVVTDGLFQRTLGSITTLPDSFSVNRWLGVTVGSNSEMTPRQQVVSVAHAYRVGTVDGASGGTISGDVTVTERVAVGSGHTVSGFLSSVTGGQNSSATGAFAHVGGGDQNAADGYASVVGGGYNNQNDGAASVIAGGGNNTITESNSVIGGGVNNAMLNQMSVIAGGNGNTANSIWAVIGGGYNNVVVGNGAVLGGGIDNLATGSTSVLSGGSSNRVRGAYSVVSGGGGAPNDSNCAEGTAATVPGGQRNYAAGTLSFAGGYRARALHHGSFVWGDSTAADVASSGEDQYVVRASGGTYLFSNTQQTEGVYLPSGSSCWQSIDTTESCVETVVTPAYVDSVFAALDSVDGLYGGQILSDVTVSGKLNAGSGNSNAGINATAIGISNDAAGTAASVLGGQDNEAAANYATVAGGRNNRARGDYSVIMGGGGPNESDSNHTDGQWSCVPGGRHNTASSAYAFAAGRNANANHTAAFVWSDNSSVGTGVSSTANNQFSVRAAGGTRFFTNSTMTLGAELLPNATAWTALSDSTQKTDIRAVDTRLVLEKVTQLPIKEWRYKEQPDPTIRHIGPMAQDFWKAFHLGEDSLGISTLDPDGVALAAIQELAKENANLRTQNSKLEGQIAQQAVRYDRELVELRDRLDQIAPMRMSAAK